MKRVTRNITLDDAQDLLGRVPRACISLATDNGPLVQPVVLLWCDHRYWIGIPENADQQPGAGQEIVLLVDEGIHFFNLRAVYIRGQVQPSASPVDAPSGRNWLELIPSKTVAWDYGKFREVSDDGE